MDHDTTFGDLERQIEGLKAENARLREALHHYQNHPPPHCDAQELIQDMGNWQCPKCGERANCQFEDGNWRWNGRAWEHWHGWPLGHVVAERVPRGTGVQEQDRGGE